MLTLTLSIYGFAILISMAVALMIRGIAAVSSIRRRPAVATTATARAPEGVAAGGDIPVAAIAAAVYAVVGPHRIVHIEHADRHPGWTAEGRASHHLSHNLSRRRH